MNLLANLAGLAGKDKEYSQHALKERKVASPLFTPRNVLLQGNISSTCFGSNAGPSNCELKRFVADQVNIDELPVPAARRVVHVRHFCAKMLEIPAGKAIHPQAAVPGGFSKPLMADERDTLRTMVGEALELAKFSIAFAKENISRSTWKWSNRWRSSALAS